MPSPKTNQPNRPQKSKFWALVELLFQGLWKHRLLYLALILLVMCSTSFVLPIGHAMKLLDRNEVIYNHAISQNKPTEPPAKK